MSAPDEEMEEVTEYVPKDGWGDFFEYLIGKTPSENDELPTQVPELSVESAKMKTDPSFSKVMATIISSDSSHESSEAEDLEEDDETFPVN